MEMENWMWKTHKIRMRGGVPSKVRLSTPYYVSKADLDRFLAAYDQYLKLKGAA
jgi:selenocysteine lyase/cysteine desulfurase